MEKVDPGVKISLTDGRHCELPYKVLRASVTAAQVESQQKYIIEDSLSCCVLFEQR